MTNNDVQLRGVPAPRLGLRAEGLGISKTAFDFGINTGFFCINR
jgi:hypothetical protein